MFKRFFNRLFRRSPKALTGVVTPNTWRESDGYRPTPLRETVAAKPRESRRSSYADDPSTNPVFYQPYIDSGSSYSYDSGSSDCGSSDSGSSSCGSD